MWHHPIETVLMASLVVDRLTDTWFNAFVRMMSMWPRVGG